MFRSNKFFQIVSGFIAFGFTILQGLDWLFNKYDVDGKWFNYIVVFLFLSFIISLIILFLKNKKLTPSKFDKINNKGRFIRIGNVILTGLLLFLFIYFFSKSQSKDSLLTKQLPEISNAFDKGETLNVFKKTKILLEKFPNNQILRNFYLKSSRKISVDTDLEGTQVFIKYFRDSIWNYIGLTPIDSIRVPELGFDTNDFNLKLINGDIEYLPEGGEYGFFDMSLIKELPPGFTFKRTKEKIFMNFPGIFLGSENVIPAFGVSKTEVSNRQYKKFLEDGGYENPDYWDFPIKIKGENYYFKNSIKLFTDKFGKFGPKNWTYGEYPEGEGNYPVRGISWFEARAYAKYKGLSLPNIFQWLDAAKLSGFTAKIPDISGSNYNSGTLKEVNFQINNTEILPNIAGNVREWVTNSHGLDRKGILGGSYETKEYTFNSFYSLSPFNRSIQNGLRLVKNLSNKNSLNENLIIKHIERDFKLEKNVSDEVFEVYKSQFDYPKTPLDVKENFIELPNKKYLIEKFEMATPYKSDEKLYGYIISSKKTEKTKPIIEFPSAGAIFNNELIINDQTIKEYKHLLDEGYSVIIPVYYNTWGREKTIKDWWPNETEEYKNTIIKIGKDFKKVIDYLETKKNLDISKLSYMGYSWGSVTSNILLAIDKRITSAAIFVGGLMLQKSRKEIESHLYVRRIKIPILHIVGKLDGIFEFEDSFLPWDELIGTNKEDKLTIILDKVGHGLPKDIMIKNHIKFLKKYN